VKSEDSDTMRRWLRDVADCLREVTDEHALRATARALHAGDWDFPSIIESRRFIAHQMLSSELSGRIYDGVAEIARPARNSLPDLIELVAPTWVNCEAARSLLPRGRQVFAVLNARWPDTAEQYVQRASCCWCRFYTETVTVITGEEQATEFRRDCEAAIRRLLCLRDGYSLDGACMPEVDVGFLVVEPNGASMDVITGILHSLLTRFPWLNVLLLVGEATPDAATLKGWGLADAVLQPELGREEEKWASQTVDRLRVLAEKVAGRHRRWQ
jgi:hypothetical protein